MAALPIPSHPSIFHLHIQISRWTPPGGGQDQCAQFFIRAHFCKNTDEIRALFLSKIRAKITTPFNKLMEGFRDLEFKGTVQVDDR